jgi:hypothetical protein
MNMKATRFLLVLAVVLMGCGGQEEENPGTGDTTEDTWANTKPTLTMASPDEMAVGDTLTILGKDFVDKTHGKLLLQIKGTYYDSKGGSQKVDYQSYAKYVNTGKITWDLYPNIVFDKTGDHLGRFVGEIIVTNQGNDGTTKYSDALPWSLNVKPSLIPRLVRPKDAGCTSTVIKDTVEKQAMAFSVEAVGLREGTTDEPLTFYWTFLADQWSVKFNNGTIDPSSVEPQSGTVQLEDTVSSGTTSTIQAGATRSFLVQVSQDLLGNGSLKTLSTGAIPSSGNNMAASLTVAAVDAAGKSTKLSIRLTVHHKADMTYNGGTEIAARYEPQMVSDCMSGGDIGRDVTYAESSSESRSRSLAFNWNVSAGVNLGLSLGTGFSSPVQVQGQLGVNFSVGFGMNISDTVSSDKSKSLSLSAHILPDEYAVCYRQTTKVYRTAQLTGYNACGQSFDLGEAILTDWIFTSDVATGPTCPPATKLQTAKQYLDD